MLQQQIAESLGLDANATIFEICAAIDAQQESLDVAAIIASLAIDFRANSYSSDISNSKSNSNSN